MITENSLGRLCRLDRKVDRLGGSGPELSLCLMYLRAKEAGDLDMSLGTDTTIPLWEACSLSAKDQEKSNLASQKSYRQLLYSCQTL